jgi:flagellar hook assembly protein FlgD
VKARAYPNPFRPQVTLALDVPRAGRISVTIFDVAQRHVRTLLDESVSAGHREILWDGRDASGRAVPSGTYFYQVRLDGERQGGRLLLLK